MEICDKKVYPEVEGGDVVKITRKWNKSLVGYYLVEDSINGKYLICLKDGRHWSLKLFGETNNYIYIKVNGCFQIED